ncbi:hypothetical protein [Streptomyces umbrinus]|uniref:hypothetical protein n=1 Tax=Streptomyces umbrinus TaxID=67370 RepID=UPI0027D8480E|nr:hypothetical protein [Streptomyces umbrinus]
MLGHLGYYCRGRRSELARFRIASVEDVGPGLLVVRKWTSKNDKNDQGREYEIDDPDAVADIQRWIGELNKRGQGDPRMPLLRRVNKGEDLDPVSRVPADLGRLGYSAGEIKEITGDWSSTEQVEKYRRMGRRRAGKPADERRSKVISELRELRTEVQPVA